MPQFTRRKFLWSGGALMALGAMVCTTGLPSLADAETIKSQRVIVGGAVRNYFDGSAKKIIVQSPNGPILVRAYYSFGRISSHRIKIGGSRTIVVAGGLGGPVRLEMQSRDGRRYGVFLGIEETPLRDELQTEGVVGSPQNEEKYQGQPGLQRAFPFENNPRYKRWR